MNRHVQTIDGIQFVYFDNEQKSENTFVFLHGYMTDSQTWNNVAKAIDPDSRIILVDLPGHGESRLISKDININVFRLSELLETLFRLMKLTDFTLVGAQMGGSIASLYISLYPQNVKNAIIMAAGALGETEENLSFFKLLAHRYIGPILCRLYPRSLFLKKWMKAHGRNYLPSDKSLDYTVSHFRKRGNEMSIVALQVRASYGQSFDRISSYLKNTSVQVRLVWGKDDHVVPTSVCDKYEALFVNATKFILDGVGDFPQEEAPKRIAEIIQAK